MTADPIDTLPAFDVPMAPAEDDKPKRSRRRKPAAATGPADTRPDTAPRQRRTKTKAATAKQVQDAATGLHQMAGAVVLPMMGKPVTGEAVTAVAEDAGKLWAQLAERYPLIGKLFTSGDTGVVFMQLLMMYAPIVQIAMAEGKSTGKAAAENRPNVPTPADVFGRPGT